MLFFKHTIHSGIYMYNVKEQNIKINHWKFYNHFINEQQHNQQPHVFQPNMLLKLYATHIRNKISNEITTTNIPHWLNLPKNKKEKKEIRKANNTARKHWRREFAIRIAANIILHETSEKQVKTQIKLHITCFYTNFSTPKNLQFPPSSYPCWFVFFTLLLVMFDKNLNKCTSNNIKEHT